MTEQEKEALRAKLGVRLDALDAALDAFEPRDIKSLIALQRQIEFARQEAIAAGAQDLIAAADAAGEAGVLDARKRTEDLLSAMRKLAHECRPGAAADQNQFDAKTGLMKREAFAQLFTELTHRHTHVAVAAVSIANAAEFRRRHGEGVATQLNTHLGSALCSIVRGQDCVASFEADNFTIFLPGEDAHGLEKALKRIQTALQKHPFVLPDGATEKLDVVISGKMLDRESNSDTGCVFESNIRVGILSHSLPTTKALDARLRIEGFATEIAATGTAKIFGANSLNALILDVPESDLPPLAEKLRTFMISRRAPMIALVRDADEGIRAQAAGITETLTRPLNLNSAVATLRQLTNRSNETNSGGTALRSSRLLIASSELFPLITIGSALQRSTGCEIYLGRGREDAIAQIDRHSPGIVLIDLRLTLLETHSLLNHLADCAPVPAIILVIEEFEKTRASMIERPPLKGAIIKPLHLLSLADEVKKMTGLTSAADKLAAAALFKTELARVMSPAFTATPPAAGA